MRTSFWNKLFVKPWLKHKLISEKAIWMHIAIGKCYNYPEVDNGNFDANIHWDAIRDMRDWTIVTFRKKTGESVEVMNNWIFNRENLPKLSKYQQEVNNI